MQELANSFEKRFNSLRTCFVKGFAISDSKIPSLNFKGRQDFSGNLFAVRNPDEFNMSEALPPPYISEALRRKRGEL